MTEMGIYNVLKFTIMLGLILFIYNLSFSIIDYIKLKNKELELKHDIEYLDTIGIVDNFITTTFNEYLIMTGYAIEGYITEKLEKEIMKSVTSLVSTRISDQLILRLSFIYDKDSIPDILAEKVFLVVTNYTININKTKGKK